MSTFLILKTQMVAYDTCWFLPYLVNDNLQYTKLYKIFNDLMWIFAFALKYLLVYFYNFVFCKQYVWKVFTINKETNLGRKICICIYLNIEK